MCKIYCFNINHENSKAILTNTKIWNQEYNRQLSSYINIHTQYIYVYFDLHHNEIKNIIHTSKHHNCGNFNSLLWNLKDIFEKFDFKTLNKSTIKLCCKVEPYKFQSQTKNSPNLQVPKISIIQYYCDAASHIFPCYYTIHDYSVTRA